MEANRKVVYHVQRVPFGMGVSYGAGVVSGLLGVGGGFIKVPAMTLVMGVPIKVAAATSNFMIGVTAVSSFLVYLGRGEVHPGCDNPSDPGHYRRRLGGHPPSRAHRRPPCPADTRRDPCVRNAADSLANFGGRRWLTDSVGSAVASSKP